VNAEVGRTALGTLLAGAPLGIAGTGLGALLRSQIAAVLAVAAWVAIGDGVSLSSSDPTLRAGCPAGWPAPSPHPESTPSRCGLRLWCRRRGPRRAGGARNRRVDQLGADVGACASEPVACAGASTGLSGPGPSVVRAPVREHGGVAPSRARTHDFFNSLERVALVGGGGARLRIAAGGGTRWEQNFWVTASVTVGSGRRWSVTRIAGSVAATRCDHAPSAWPSTAEGVDDPSGNQRGAAGEGEPGSFRERRDDPADLLLQGDSARHHDAAPRLEPSRPPAVDVVRQHKFWHKSTSSASTT
jgi:hypothetical protein